MGSGSGIGDGDTGITNTNTNYGHAGGSSVCSTPGVPCPGSPCSDQAWVLISSISTVCHVFDQVGHIVCQF
jgi:hypothetical protein